MCYMDRVGVRELRQNLSVYLRRVAQGESLEVTERGHPVAVLAPLPDRGALRSLVASGRLRPAQASLKALPEALSSGSTPISEVLAEQRAQER